MSELEDRVVAAAADLLGHRKAVAPLDVLGSLGWITQNDVDHWQRGRTAHLGPLLQMRAEKLDAALAALESWASGRGLVAREAEYVSGTRDRRQLRFVDRDDATERALRTHWISGGLTAAQQDRVVERQSTPPDLVVVIPTKEFECAGCGGTDAFLMMDDAGPLCLTCADLDSLVFLPAGDATLTRRAKKASPLAAVVVQWNRSRKRYQRRGVLVGEAALAAAEASCLADEEVRLRQRERDKERRARQDVELTARMAAEIGRLFPGCPRPRAEAIAAHTAVRGSGRVGRSAAGRALQDDALIAAVVASVRHEDTEYDALLMAGVAREEARARIRGAVDAVLDTWRAPRAH